MQLVALIVPADDHVHIFRGVLRGAGAQPVQAKGIFIILAVVVFILAAGIHLTEDQLPVVALLVLVPVHGAAAAEILHLDGLVRVSGDGDEIAKALPRLINGIGENLKHGMFAALQPIRAENDRRTLAHAVRTLEHGDAVVAVSICRSLCHMFHPSLDVVFECKIM